MDNKTFSELLRSAGEALAHAKGKLELKTTVLPAPPEPMTAAEIKNLRGRLNASQAVFAHYLSVSPKLVQAWEARRRQPQGPALLLLRIAERDPRSLVAAFKATSMARESAKLEPAFEQAVAEGLGHATARYRERAKAARKK